MNLHQAIFDNKSHSTPAIFYENRSISYDELCDQTVTLAKALVYLGVGKSDRVAILLNDSPEFVEAFIAICSIGAIAVPINVALKQEDQRTIVYKCGAHIAIIERTLGQKLLTDPSEMLHHLTAVVVVDRETRLNSLEMQLLSGVPTHGWEDLKEVAAGDQSPDFPAPADNEPAFILYTSGSTGEPKGAVHRQADIFHTNETFCRQVLQLTSNDRLFSSSRLPFAYGLGNCLSFPLLNGATSILCREKPGPDVISRVFSYYKPTIFFAVPLVYKLLVDYHRREGAVDCSSLRLCISAGEALPAHLGEDWEKTFGVQILDGIGSTEMLHMFISNRKDDVFYGSSGKLVKGYDAVLRDEDDQEIASDTEGNLWVRGASAAIRYWERPDETARTFVNGWVRTGDLYRRDAEGYWFHMGRSDDCFKSSGQWVSPAEVEGALLRHPNLRAVGVVEDFDDSLLPCPCAFVVSQDVESHPANLEKELRDLAATALPRFKQPRKYVFVSELPYTATGKIQRFKLRQKLRGVVNSAPDSGRNLI